MITRTLQAARLPVPHFDTTYSNQNPFRLVQRAIDPAEWRTSAKPGRRDSRSWARSQTASDSAVDTRRRSFALLRSSWKMGSLCWISPRISMRSTGSANPPSASRSMPKTINRPDESDVTRRFALSPQTIRVTDRWCPWRYSSRWGFPSLVRYSDTLPSDLTTKNHLLVPLPLLL